MKQQRRVIVRPMSKREGESGVAVDKGTLVHPSAEVHASALVHPSAQVHASALVDPGAHVGADTRIWHFCHVERGAHIGERCMLGQNVYVGPGVRVGSGTRVQNNVSLYAGVTLSEDVFLGPSCVLTNVKNPRVEAPREGEFDQTRILRGVTVGANATIVCGVTIHEHAFIAAGAVITRDVPRYALMRGVPAVQDGYMSRHGQRLSGNQGDILTCEKSGLRYLISEDGMTGVDVADDAPLP